MIDNRSYTGKDIKAIRQELIDFIKLSNPDWTDFNMSSIQMQYTELCAGVADMLCYYLDNQALETFLMSARQKKNIHGILTTMNYKISPIGTAQGEVTISRRPHEVNLQQVALNYEEGRIKVPKYTKVLTEDPTGPEYLTTEEVLFTNDIIWKNVPIIQGIRRILNYPVSVVGRNFKLYLTERPVPLEYVEILDEEWEKVEDAFLEINGGKKYSVHCDSKGYVYLLFTYDWNRYLSQEEGAVLSVQVIESRGEAGKVEAYALKRLVGDVIDIDTEESVSSKLEVENKRPTYGAFDEEDLNRQKANARNYLKAYDRIILLEDFETMLKKEPYIKDVKCLDWRRNDVIVPYPHQMKAWVVTVDGPETSGEILRQITKKMQDLTVVMTAVEVFSAQFVDVDLRVGISVAGNSETLKEKIRAEVEENLKRMYSLRAFIEGDEESLLGFGTKISKNYLKVQVVQMNKAIIDDEVEGIETVDEETGEVINEIQLSEIEFFNFTRIEVYLY